jgi:hypothetical protein
MRSRNGASFGFGSAKCTSKCGQGLGEAQARLGIGEDASHDMGSPSSQLLVEAFEHVDALEMEAPSQRSSRTQWSSGKSLGRRQDSLPTQERPAKERPVG